jgi:DNA (cytosine-5)-methyltransferase 1
MKKNVDTTKTTTHVSLCAGYGGIDLGLGRAIPNLRTIAFSEIEAFACANLVSKMEAGFLDAAPIWTNLKTFPWSDFRDRVDILSGGYPCQPFSAAGKRLGRDDPRHLWPWIADGIRAMRPRICFFENVEGHISLGLREVISELEGLGYATTWGVFSAREVGAPHQRKRVFILANRKQQGLEGLARHVANRDQSGWHNSQSDGSVAQGGLWRRVSFAADCEGCDEETGELGDICSLCGLDYCEECECPGPTQDGMEYADQDGILYARPKSKSQAWPSGPGEPQHGWEPPRVVGDTTNKRDFNKTQQDNSKAGTLLDRTSEGLREVLGNAILHGHATSEISGSTSQSEAQGRVQELAGGSPSVGNSNGSRPQEWKGQGGSGLQGTDSDGGEDAERQAEPSLGRDIDGAADWMDNAELFVTTDNRTDELRLLGNGVVPATATRAFLILMKQLLNDHQ